MAIVMVNAGEVRRKMHLIRIGSDSPWQDEAIRRTVGAEMTAGARRMTDERTGLDFESVAAAELAIVKARRKGRGMAETAAAPDLTGLALSGGGIRSAATCLGAIQALRANRRFAALDYLSTVSGGGYTGACLTAAMSDAGGAAYPFGDDISDSEVVAHIRNYSNYLLPRSRSAIRNGAEAAAILLRGLIVNAICVFAVLLIVVIVTKLAFPTDADLGQGDFAIRALWGLGGFFGHLPAFFHAIYHDPRAAIDTLWLSTAQNGAPSGIMPFAAPMAASGALVVLLIGWAMLRSVPLLDGFTSDTASRLLGLSYILLIVSLTLLFIDVQPLAIRAFQARHAVHVDIKAIFTGLAAFGGAVSGLAGTFGKFLETSKRSQSLTTIALRIATRALLMAAALVLPLLIWITYVVICAWVIPNANCALFAAWRWLPETRFGLVLAAALIANVIMFSISANGYSLHRLYRDRLSKAFLVAARGTPAAAAGRPTKLARVAAKLGDLPPLDTLKLSALRNSDGPYPLINAALNVQGSLEANKRGRNADFFTFTPDHIGSDLTGFVGTEIVETVDSRIDLASAMAISGAAASANMGGNTIRMLSPTLSLLNIRLGYYLKNPFYLGEEKNWKNRIRAWWGEFADLDFLLIEMFNGLTERRRNIYLTDGGHIENLGIYTLLQRHCRLIFAIDSEADPELSSESLLKVERYARIDLGARIILPWEAIASHSRGIADAIANHAAPRDRGPHVAVGRIYYRDGSEGILVYVKASLSGDEKDYILDYAQRHPAFPHETTGDQFFTEEQFEMYRALGFHMVSGLFDSDAISFIANEPFGFPDRAAVRAEIDRLLPPG
jgi:hypothetical protein